MEHTTALAPRRNWLGRAAGWTLRALRLAEVVEQPQEHSAGSDFATGLPQPSSYDQRRAHSAYPANAWLAAGVNAITTDLAGVPIRISRVGDRKALVDDHPMHALIEAPWGSMDGRLWRAQSYAHRILGGNCPWLVLESSIGRGPVGLPILHPARLRPRPGSDGTAIAYDYDGNGKAITYSADAVEVIRGLSWQDDPRGLWGMGVVQPLDADISADLALAQASARQASKGRPDATYSPASDKVMWNPVQVREMTANLNRMMAESAGGVAVLSGQGKLDILGWSARDMQIPEQRAWTRQVILAVLDVPPVRVGLETANYATAREQNITYWTGLKGRAAEFDAALTRIANRFGGSEVEVWHDFSQVPALQAAQSEALERVSRHIANGMDPAQAYQYEGFAEVDGAWFLPALPAMGEGRGDVAGVTIARPGHSAELEEARDELAAALDILMDDEATAGDVADAIASVEAALDALAPMLVADAA